ncbi:hypothetical protein MAR_020381, partial [Mya arenaria]
MANGGASLNKGSELSMLYSFHTMATGGSSLYKESDLVHDYGCSKCEEHDINTYAQHFCTECEHYLCDKCVKLHNGYHKTHTVYGRGDIQKWAGYAMAMCDQHGNKLEVHCDDHQDLCCHVCVALNHRLCSSISHLPDLARNFLKTAEFKQLPAALPSGGLLIADNNNYSVKHLNSEYVVTASCDFPAPPEHLCRISGNEVAVVVSDSNRHEVHFIHITRGKLQRVRKFTTNHRCVCIAHDQGQLYVSSWNILYQYNMNGKIIRNIYEDKSIGLTVRRQCSSISHLPDLSRDFLKTAEFKQLPVAVDKMRSRLGELTNARLKYQASLTDMYKDILAEIKALRKKMNNILDHLEKKTVKELDSMIKGLETNIKVDIDACTHMHDQLKTMIKKVQQMTGKHKETNSYIGYRRCQDKLDKAEEQMQTMQRKPEPRISFKPDSSLQPFLNNLHVFGSIEKFEILHVYKALDFKTYYVKENDNFRFSIVGICELPSGDLVIANKKNSKVIFLNRQYDVTASCDLPFPPEDLCLISGNEVAISVNDSIRHEVHFINVTRGKLQKVTHSTTVHWCF